MIYLIYALLVPISLILTVISIPLAPILVLFARPILGWCDNHSYEAVEPRLPSWLDWFMTPDNSLNGDATFQTMFPPGQWWSQVHWLWRNPAYSFALRYLGTPYTTSVQGDKTIKDNDNAKAGWCKVSVNGLFQFTLVTPIGFSRCIYVNLGWNIRGLVDDNVQPKPDIWQATYVFSPRISGFR